MNSLPLPADDILPPEVVQRLKDRPAINIFRMFGHVPQAVVPWTDLITAMYKGTLSPREREVAILRQGARARGDYEVHQHRLIALANGMTEMEIKGITSFGPVPSLSERENLICAIADQLECDARLDDDLFKRGQAMFGVSQFVEVIMLISIYAAVGRFTNATRVEIEKNNPLAGHGTPN